MADVLDRAIVLLDTQEGSAYGAALLALTGTGAYGSIEEACRACIHEADRIQPNTDSAEEYARMYRVYQALYPALKPIYGMLG